MAGVGIGWCLSAVLATLLLRKTPFTTVGNWMTYSLRAAALLLLCTPSSLWAQDPSRTVSGAAALITEALIRRHVAVIADDSMLGRDTPSRGLEATASYIVANFRRLGIAPGIEGYVQRYAVKTQRVNQGASSIRFRSGTDVAEARLDSDVLLLGAPRAARGVTGAAVLLGGNLDSAGVLDLDMRNRVVLLVLDLERPQASLGQVVGQLLDAHPLALVVVANRDTGVLARIVARQRGEQTGVDFADEQPLLLEVNDRAVAQLLTRSGVNLSEVRSSTRTVTTSLPALEVTVDIVLETVREASAPNVVGVVRGNDPALRDEYIVFSAHMDHVGVNASSAADSIWNGADDNASGTAGILALAEAFSRAPTRRSLVFLAVSGEEKGLWGSDYFTRNSPIPLERIVAGINLDMIGRNWKDTIAVIGMEHSDLGETLMRVAASRPELRMQPIGDIWPQEQFYFRSDHYNFARRGVPILFFFNGTHADYHQPSDSPDKIDAEKAARVARLVYYLGEAIGNADARPRWNPESYRRIVGGGR